MWCTRDGRAGSVTLVALTGAPGAGKSTLAATYRERGYRVISTDYLRAGHTCPPRRWSARCTGAPIARWPSTWAGAAHLLRRTPPAAVRPCEPAGHRPPVPGFDVARGAPPSRRGVHRAAGGTGHPGGRARRARHPRGHRTHAAIPGRGGVGWRGYPLRLKQGGNRDRAWGGERWMRIRAQVLRPGWCAGCVGVRARTRPTTWYPGWRGVAMRSTTFDLRTANATARSATRKLDRDASWSRVSVAMRPSARGPLIPRAQIPAVFFGSRISRGTDCSLPKRP